MTHLERLEYIAIVIFFLAALIVGAVFQSVPFAVVTFIILVIAGVLALGFAEVIAEEE